MPVTPTIAIARHVFCVTFSVTLIVNARVARADPQTVAVASGAQNRSAGESNEDGVEPTTEAVDLSTMDRRGIIRVDGRIVAQGDFRGRLVLGTHVISITQPGYDPFETTIVLRTGDPYVKLVSLTPSVVVRPFVGSNEAMRGVYGGFLLNAAFEPGGLNSTICSVQGVTNCSTASPIGGGVFGTLGYTTDPIGLDALFGVQADGASVTATADGHTASGVIPRVGGVLAARARFAWQNRAMRWTAAAGVGLALRRVGLLGGGLDTATYVAPAITIAAAVHVRVTKTTAISLGVLFWGENAGHGEQLQVKPLPTPVIIVRSTQAFLLPFIGVELGP